jgi:hypothetical protein
VSGNQKFLFVKAGEAGANGHAPATAFGLLKRGEEALRPGHDYVRVQILRRELERGIVPTKSVYPVLHLRAAASNGLDFQVIDAPKLLEETSKRRLDRIYHAPTSVIGPTPFRPDLHLEFGLFAATATDRLGEALSILADLSNLAATPFIGAALPFAHLVKGGVERLLGDGTGLRLDVGFRGGVASVSSPGTYALIYGPNGSVNLDRLSFDTNNGQLLYAGRRLGRLAYVTFEVERLNWRDDWQDTPSLSGPWQAVRDAAGLNDAAAVEFAIRQFQRACMTSPDLCRDQVAALNAFASELYAEMAATFASAGASPGRRPGSTSQDPGDIGAAFAERYDVQPVAPKEKGIEGLESSTAGRVLGNRRLVRRPRPVPPAGADRSRG